MKFKQTPFERDSRQKYYGKYRGTVLNNSDPLKKGRLLVKVPDVSGFLPTGWAEPCLPAAGMQNGLFALPPIRSLVWVEFERGEADHPIWVGGFWGTTAEVPLLAQTAPPGVSSLTLQTTLGNGVIISDKADPTGGIMIKSPKGATLIVNDTGIYLKNGKGASLVMTAKVVNINDNALVIT
jgi:uncharacterized protein involved in type VI secretion and phage assembly